MALSASQKLAVVAWTQPNRKDVIKLFFQIAGGLCSAPLHRLTAAPSPVDSGRRLVGLPLLVASSAWRVLLVEREIERRSLRDRRPLLTCARYTVRSKEIADVVAVTPDGSSPACRSATGGSVAIVLTRE